MSEGGFTSLDLAHGNVVWEKKGWKGEGWGNSDSWVTTESAGTELQLCCNQLWKVKITDGIYRWIQTQPAIAYSSHLSQLIKIKTDRLTKGSGFLDLTHNWGPKAFCTREGKLVREWRSYQNPQVQPWCGLQLDGEKIKMYGLIGLWKLECLNGFYVKKLCLLYLNVLWEWVLPLAGEHFPYLSTVKPHSVAKILTEGYYKESDGWWK